VNRRVAALLAAALAAAQLQGCSFPCSSPSFVVRNAEARAPGPAPALPGPSLRALHLADFGDGTCQQEKVAGAVAREHARSPFQLALFPGDNIYDCGPDVAVPGADACRFGADGNTVAPGFTPPTDPSFARHEAPLAPLAEGPGVPVYLALGNHDVSTGCGAVGDPAAISRLRACLEVAHVSPLWRMPARHYVVDQGPARFIVFDSNLLKRDYGGFTIDEEVAFVADAAEGCEDRTCFLVGHHPPVTAGAHRDDATAEYVGRVNRILEAAKGRVRGWLVGHDHDLQHLRTPSGVDVFVSGNGARGRAAERFRSVSVQGGTLLFGSVIWGYAVLEVAPGGWRYAFHDLDGAPLYCCAAAGAGRCEPFDCASLTARAGSRARR
jgi:tartrate-resistant acid phosphatase type 5